MMRMVSEERKMTKITRMKRSRTWGEKKCRDEEDKDVSRGRTKMRNLQQLTAITVSMAP